MENFRQYFLYFSQIPQKNCGTAPPRPEKANWGNQPLCGCNKVSQHIIRVVSEKPKQRAGISFLLDGCETSFPPTHTLSMGGLDFHPHSAAMRSHFPATVRLCQKRYFGELDLSSSPSGNKASSSALSVETMQEAWTPTSTQH